MLNLNILGEIKYLANMQLFIAFAIALVWK